MESDLPGFLGHQSDPIVMSAQVHTLQAGESYSMCLLAVVKFSITG